MLSYVILIFIAAMLYMIMGIKIASLMNEVGYGTASDASFVIIVLSLGGISAGLIFWKNFKDIETIYNYNRSITFIISNVDIRYESTFDNDFHWWFFNWIWF